MSFLKRLFSPRHGLNHFAVYMREDLNTVNHNYVVHAFPSAQQRNDWVATTNRSNRDLNNNAKAYAVTADDMYVKIAKSDVVNNPDLYKRNTYSSYRMYIEHTESL